MEVDVAKGRRDWAFSERDKVIFGSLYISYLHFFTTLVAAKITIFHSSGCFGAGINQNVV